MPQAPRPAVIPGGEKPITKKRNGEMERTGVKSGVTNMFAREEASTGGSRRICGGVFSGRGRNVASAVVGKDEGGC